MREFSSFHPIALFLYFVSIFAIAIISVHPIMVCIFIFCTTLCYLQTCGWDAFKKSAPYKALILFILVLSNPLFVHQGVTILTYVNGNPITLEAIVYGICFAFMMGGIWNVCACYQVIMDNEKFIYLFGCILPSFALIISMALRLIPKFKRQLFIIKETQQMLAVESLHKSYIVKARELVEILSILITWAFETSIVSADSMKARGYGTRRRINFHNYHIRKRDCLFICMCLLMSLIIFSFYIFGYKHVYFYPHITKLSFDLLSCIGYVCYAMYLVMPICIQRWEERRWKSSISKI